MTNDARHKTQGAEETRSKALEEALANSRAEVGELRRQLDLARENVNAITRSRSWRMLVLVQRLWRVVRGLVRIPRQALRKISRWLTQRNPFVEVPIDPDFVETCYEPRWDKASQSWQLELNRQRLNQARRAQGTTAHSIKPYILKVRPRASADRTRPRVMHVIPNVFVGGSTQLVIDLIENLQDRFEQDVITSALWRGGLHQGMVTHHFPLPIDEARLAKLFVEKQPDIVHIHYWGLTDDPWYRAVLHAIDPLDCKVVQNINTPIKPLVHPYIDHYVYVSEYVRTIFGTEANNPVTSSVIHPGIDLSLFDKPISGADSYNAIGMVYRLETDKLREDSIQLLIAVAQRRPQTKIYIVGGGSLFRSFVEQTKAAGVRQNFHFTGYVPYETLPTWYEKFAIFVAPVWQESFGQVSVFAMNKKMAVAGFKIGALPEILDSDATFGDDVPTAADKIVALLNDPQRLKALGEKNRARAQSEFSVVTMAKRYGEIYDRLLAKS